MAKRRRTSRAQNKVGESSDGALIKVDPEPLSLVPAEVDRSTVTTVRSTLFSAEFERVIEIIAVERVYRATLAGRLRRLLTAVPQPPGEHPGIAE